MTTILAYLKNIRLSVTEWLGVTAASAIALLLALLEYKDEQISQLKTKAVEQEIGTTVTTAEEERAVAQKKLQDALKAYTDNGGKL